MDRAKEQKILIEALADACIKYREKTGDNCVCGLENMVKDVTDFDNIPQDFSQFTFTVRISKKTAGA